MDNRDRHIYGANGEYKGSVSTSSPSDIAHANNVVSLLIVGGIGWWVWGVLSNWASLAQPYRGVAAFYYWIIVYPLKGFSWVWSYATHPGFTDFPNLNIVIAVCGVLAYFILLLIGCAIILAVLQLIKLERHWKTIVFSPAVFCLLWFLGSGAHSWLFAPK